jgi:phosphatidylserine synthase
MLGTTIKVPFCVTSYSLFSCINHTICWGECPTYNNIIIIIIIITIIGKETISFVQGIYTYIPETIHVPKEYKVAAILSLLFMVPISLAPALALIYYYYYYYYHHHQQQQHYSTEGFHALHSPFRFITSFHIPLFYD